MPCRVPLLLLCVASPAVAGVAYPLPPLPVGMKRVEGQFHLLIHDLTDAEGAEAMARMEAMVREYQRRTRDFSGRLSGRMPFILFRNDVDYIAAGGPEGTAGVFNGEVLKAVAGKKLTSGTWRTIQHEGFHQFAHAVIGGELPIWVNEGLAEYFGEGIYTGDTIVTGGIPAYRRERIVAAIKDKQFKPLSEMMALPHEQWNREMKEGNYDQAWAMVQFLAHGDGGKYQRAFGEFMIALSRRRPWQRAWDEAFGAGDGFANQWESWWLARPANATPAVYTEAATRMLANYAARAASQTQRFATVDDLLAAIEKNAVKTAPGDALPPGLAADCVGLVAAVRKVNVAFAFEFAEKNATNLPVAVTATLPDGRVIRATTPTRGPRAGTIVLTTKGPTTRRRS